VSNDLTIGQLKAVRASIPRRKDVSRVEELWKQPEQENSVAEIKDVEASEFVVGRLSRLPEPPDASIVALDRFLKPPVPWTKRVSPEPSCQIPGGQ